MDFESQEDFDVCGYDYDELAHTPFESLFLDSNLLDANDGFGDIPSFHLVSDDNAFDYDAFGGDFTSMRDAPRVAHRNGSLIAVANSGDRFLPTPLPTASRFLSRLCCDETIPPALADDDEFENNRESDDERNIVRDEERNHNVIPKTPNRKYLVALHDAEFPACRGATGAYKKRKISFSHRVPAFLPSQQFDVPIDDNEETDDEKERNLWNCSRQLIDCVDNTFAIVCDKGNLVFCTPNSYISRSEEEHVFRSVKLSENGTIAAAFCFDAPRSIFVFQRQNMCAKKSKTAPRDEENNKFYLVDVVPLLLRAAAPSKRRARRNLFPEFSDNDTSAFPESLSASSSSASSSSNASATSIAEKDEEKRYKTSTPCLAFCDNDSALVVAGVDDGLQVFAMYKRQNSPNDVENGNGNTSSRKIHAVQVYANSALRIVRAVAHSFRVALVDTQQNVWIFDWLQFSRVSAAEKTLRASTFLYSVGTTCESLLQWSVRETNTISIVERLAGKQTIVDIDVCTRQRRLRYAFSNAIVEFHWFDGGRRLIVVERIAKDREEERGEEEREGNGQNRGEQEEGEGEREIRGGEEEEQFIMREYACFGAKRLCTKRQTNIGGYFASMIDGNSMIVLCRRPVATISRYALKENESPTQRKRKNARNATRLNELTIR